MWGWRLNLGWQVYKASTFSAVLSDWATFTLDSILPSDCHYRAGLTSQSLAQGPGR